MVSVQRYDISPEYFVDLQEQDEGSYVSYTDYVILKIKLEETYKTNSNLIDTIHGLHDMIEIFKPETEHP